MIIKGGDRMDYNKNINKLYIIIFFHNLIPAYVIERLFWHERGMTVFMVVLCEIIYAVTIVIFEIPTGIIADIIGRKSLLVFGAVLSMLEFVMLLFSHNFWAFALVVFLAGISGACTSGAFNALLYDSLLTSKGEKSFEKVLGRINSFDFIGALLAALSGSVLAKLYGFEFNYILSAVSMFIALGFTILLREPPRINHQEKRQEKLGGLKDYFISSVSFYRNNPKLAFVIVHAMAIGACISYLDEFWQLYLDEIGFSIVFFGVFSAVVSLARIPGNLVTEYLIKYFKEESIILSILGITSGAFFITAVFPGKVGIAAIIIIFLASGVVAPVITGYLHHQSSSEIRATVDSIQSLIERAISFIVGIGFGIVASRGTVISGFVFLGAVSCMFFLIFITRIRY